MVAIFRLAYRVVLSSSQYELLEESIIVQFVDTHFTRKYASYDSRVRVRRFITCVDDV